MLHFKSDASSLGVAIREFDSAFRNSWDVIGNDLKLAYRLDAINPSPHSRVFYRPAIEPILLNKWDVLSSFRLNESESLTICSLLVGSKQQFRTQRMYGLGYDGKRFDFAKMPSRYWLVEVMRLASEDVDWIDKIAAILSLIVYEHPFTDGNGRFGRSLVYGVMAQSRVIQKPSFGANATLDLGRVTIGPCVQRAVQANEFAPLRTELIKIFHKSLEIMVKITGVNFPAYPIS